MSKVKVAVALSGGVDSSTVSALLLDQGYDVFGVTMEVGPDPEDHAVTVGARATAELLGIPFYSFDFRELFSRSIIAPFVETYQKGQTPNPCVVCNPLIKFGALLEAALKLGADYLATGHYARVEQVKERYLLKRGADLQKDQSYVLYGLSQAQLAHILFPLGAYSKEKTRELAQGYNLPNAEKSDSQEICFIPRGNYRDFLCANLSQPLQPGAIVDVDGRVLGEHRGIALYTIGQRKGLGIAAGIPLYVVDLDPERNEVVVGPKEAVCGHSFLADGINLISIPNLQEPMEVEAKIRYNAGCAKATIEPVERGVIRTVFAQPQFAITPGQAVVWYQGDVVVGGGRIFKRD
ncbi:MAG: tRNA 2-thiouridine(34) synthase MnmA [Limnochordia bacterium]|nr:tRNA 2-thiouridine(34) synthase MnmA [Limnochordia bacterium]MDD4517751.1 tRNA 2-thiouridine(34) synthase MnmA [Limnochordia bacterium]